MNLLRFFISLVEVDLPIQNHGVFLSFIKNPLSRKLNFIQNKGSRDFFKNDRKHRLLSSFEKRFNRGKSCNPFSSRFCFVITKRFQGFLRGMINDLIGGTFNLKHFHGDRIWSAFCASIFCALSLTAAETNAQVGAAAAVAAAADATSANSAL